MSAKNSSNDAASKPQVEPADSATLQSAVLPVRSNEGGNMVDEELNDMVPAIFSVPFTTHPTTIGGTIRKPGDMVRLTRQYEGSRIGEIEGFENDSTVPFGILIRVRMRRGVYAVEPTEVEAYY